MSDGLEHLAAWRGRNPLTIRHAGSLIAGVDPNYQFPLSSKMTDAERERFAVVTGWRERLWSAAQGQSEGPPLAATIINKVTEHKGSGQWMREYSEAKRPWTEKTPDPALSTVRVEDLCAWLESIGHRPAFFFPGEQGRALDGPAMRGHENESDLLRVLIRASANFWKPADRQEKDTHPANKDVAKWLERNGFTPSLAKHAASIIRPNWAATGRPTEK